MASPKAAVSAVAVVRGEFVEYRTLSIENMTLFIEKGLFL